MQNSEVIVVGRTRKLAAGSLVIALVALVVVGVTATVGHAAPLFKKPVVSGLSPASGTIAGGATVTITGKNFTKGGKSIVRKITFGAKAATKVRVLSPTRISVTAPAGKGSVYVRVVTKFGTSAGVRAAIFTYRRPAKIAIHSGDGQSAEAGTAVAIPPSVIVTDSAGRPVAGVKVTFAVVSGGGSAAGLSAVTGADGVAAVGSWTLGISGGVNVLTAASAGLNGSPVSEDKSY